MFDDKIVQDEIKNWPFTVIDQNAYPVYEVTCKSTPEFYSPENIASYVLKTVKKNAESFINDTITDIVITVPANFNTIQREATKNAAKAAGLNVISIINEPVAAALAYNGLNNKIKNNEYVFLYDLGGGTFDVSVLKMEDGVLIVKATGGDQHLGGEDFTNILLNHFVVEFNSKYKCDIRLCNVSMKRLYDACEKVKIDLSDSLTASFDEFGLFNGHDFSGSITRDTFENLCDCLFDRTFMSVENVLKDANVEVSDIRDIILVGGSTRITKIQKVLKQFFGKELSKSINPDEAVAYGAALQASMLKGQLDNVLLVDVTPVSLGIEIKAHKMSVLISRNTRLPYRYTREYTTTEDNQTSVKISVYEGDSQIVLENIFLDSFTLQNIPAEPKGVPKIVVTFEMDINGILTVSAVLKSDTELSRKISINRQRNPAKIEVIDVD